MFEFIIIVQLFRFGIYLKNLFSSSFHRHPIAPDRSGANFGGFNTFGGFPSYGAFGASGGYGGLEQPFAGPTTPRLSRILPSLSPHLPPRLFLASHRVGG